MDGTEKRRVPQQNPTLSGNSATLVLTDPVEAGTLEVAGGVDNNFAPRPRPSLRKTTARLSMRLRQRSRGRLPFAFFANWLTALRVHSCLITPLRLTLEETTPRLCYFLV
jgi:hypothetical protein